MTYGRHTECSHFMVDVQDTPAPWKMVRTPKTDKAQTATTYSLSYNLAVN